MRKNELRNCRWKLVFEIDNDHNPYAIEYHYYCSVHTHWKRMNYELPTYQQLKEEIKRSARKKDESHGFDRF